MYKCLHARRCRCQGKPEENGESPLAGVTDDFERLDVGESLLEQEPQAFLTTKHLFSPPSSFENMILCV